MDLGKLKDELKEKGKDELEKREEQMKEEAKRRFSGRETNLDPEKKVPLQEGNSTPEMDKEKDTDITDQETAEIPATDAADEDSEDKAA